MKRIGIEVNGVLRDTIEKFKQIYEKHLIDLIDLESVDKKYEVTFSGETDDIIEMNEELIPNSFEYKVLSPVTSLNLLDHFSFQSKEELYSFMFEDYTMELFGHAPSTEMNTFNVLNDIYYDLRENFDLIILSDEIGKSKPATLFFLSKFGCLLEKVIFYSETTKNNIWNEVDILLTANPTLLLEKPDDKIVIKYNTDYNKQIKSDYEINTLSDFKKLVEKIIEYV
jgi:hypothetical protein